MDRIVVHRTALRPIKTGEMTLTHEARTLARPFNLKRFTTSDGIHTLPISFLSDHVDGEDDDDELQVEGDAAAAAEEDDDDDDDDNADV